MHSLSRSLWKILGGILAGMVMLGCLGALLAAGAAFSPAAAQIEAEPTVMAGLYLPAIRHDPSPTPLPTPTATPSGTPVVDPERENDVIALINQQRDDNSLNSLTVDEQLVQAARRHSSDMAANNNTSHTGTDGSTPKQRIEAAGYEPSWHGEIIAWGFPDAAGAVGWWMNSTVHRSMILSPEFADLGVGYGASDINFRHYWAVTFGRRTAGSPDQNLVLCTYRMTSGARGSSLSVWLTPPCPAP